jgi:AcrR family transcriptional regulator
VGTVPFVEHLTAPNPPARSAGRGAETRRRILGAAEELFAERGIDGVSLREITSAAGANSAAAHYHFGSKDAVLAELFDERARAIVDRRLELLRDVRRDAAGAPVVEDVLRAFLRPALDAAVASGGTAFMRLRALLAFEAATFRRDVLSKAFDASSRQFLEELHLALPDVPVEDLHWRFHFTLGAMTYTMATPGRIESITHGELDSSENAAALEQLVRFAAAGLRAP